MFRALHKPSCSYLPVRVYLRPIRNTSSVFKVQGSPTLIKEEPKRKKKLGLGAFVLLCLPLATFKLGLWQLERRKWKLQLIEDVEKKNATSVLKLPQSWDQFEGMEYQKYEVEGEFDHSRELVLHPRMQKTEAPKNKFEQRSRGPVGAHVVTPFKVKDRNVTILINRGWIPKTKLDPNTRKEGQINGVHKIVAMYRPTQKKSTFVKENIPEKNHYFYRNVLTMAKQLGTEPVYLDAVSGKLACSKYSTVTKLRSLVAEVEGGPIGNQVALEMRNVHAVYAVQWFTLTFFGSLLWYMRYLR